MSAIEFFGVAYACTALVVGCYATFVNRELFRRATKRYLRMAFHIVVVGMMWPLLASAAIAALR